MLCPWGQPWPPLLGEERVSTSKRVPPPEWGAAVLHPDTETVTRRSYEETVQHQGGSEMGFAQMAGLALASDREGMGEEQGETRGKGAGWDGNAILCLLVWFPSKLVQ